MDLILLYKELGMEEKTKVSRLSKNVLMTMLVTGTVLAGSTTGFAAEEDTQAFTLDEMIVTATRTEMNTQKVPASVDVITAEEIKEKNIMTVDQALRGLAGIVVNRPKGLADASSSIQMRGFSDQDILVMLDGQQMNSPFSGNVNWNAIPIENIARIEIVRGAGSSLYGGRATGGVINIITKDPTDTSFHGGLSFGTHNTWRKELSMDAKVNDKVGVSVGWTGRKTDGYNSKPVYLAPKAVKTGTENAYGGNEYKTVKGKTNKVLGEYGDNWAESNTYNTKVKYKFDESKSLSYAVIFDKYKYGADNPISYMKDARGNPVWAGNTLVGGVLTNFGKSKFCDNIGYRETIVHALNYNDSEKLFNLNIGMTDVRKDGYSTASDPDNISGAGTRTNYPSKAKNVDLQKTWENIGKHTIVAGANYQNHEMERTMMSVTNTKDFDSTTGIPTDLAGGSDKSFALFLQDEYKLTDRWKVYTGLRYDNYKKYGGYNTYSNKSRTYEDASYSELSPKLAFEYEIDEDTNAYVSYGHSFTPATLNQLFKTSSSVLSNPELEPESSDSFEIGFKKNINDATKVSVAFFYSKTKDMIALTEEIVPDPQENNILKKQYQNIESAKRKGIELGMKHQLSKKWNSFANYTYQKVENEQNSSMLSGFPEHIFHLGFGYEAGKWGAFVDGEYVSEANGDDSKSSGVYGSSDGRFTANLGVNYAVQKNATIKFAINNLFDRQYYDNYLADGRTYTIGVDYRF
jgi:iron complex outermembrane receptor protein